MSRAKFCSDGELRERTASLLRLDAANFTTPREFFQRNSQLLCFKARKEYRPRQEDSLLKTNMGHIQSVFFAMTSEEWKEPRLKYVSEQLVESLLANWKMDQSNDPTKDCRNALNRFLRWALTGGRPGLTVTSTLALLGRDESVRRIQDAASSFEYTPISNQ